MPAEAQTPRVARACTICNNRKIKCKFSSGQQTCDSCLNLSIDCIPRSRKRRIVKKLQSSPERLATQDNSPPVQNEPFWQPGATAWVSENSQPTLQESTSYSPTNAAWTTTTAGRTEVGSYESYDGRIIQGQPVNNAMQHGALRNQQHGDPRSERERHYDTAKDPSEDTYVGRSYYIAQDTPIDETRARAYASRGEAPLSETELKTLDLWTSFELPPRSVRQSLIDTYMQRCYPWTPILKPGDLEVQDGRMPSQLLTQAAFLAASRVSSAPSIKAYASSEQFYQRAKALFWCGHEKSSLTLIAATIILQWYNADGPEHVSLDTSRIWSYISTGLAHQVGLHKEPLNGKDASYRRRLWWSLVARDCLISAGQGRPRAIDLKDCDVRPPCIEDFLGSESEGELFIPYVEICVLLGDLTECCSRKHFSRSQRIYLEAALYRWSNKLPTRLRLSWSNETGRTAMLPYSFNARQLHIPYFTTVAIMARSTATRGISVDAVLASSFISGIFEDFLARDEVQYLGPIFTFYLLAAGVALTSTRLHQNLWKVAQQDLEVLQNSLKELSKRWPSGVGAMKALQNVIERTPRLQHGKPSQNLDWMSAEQEQLFKGFGQELCRMWVPCRAQAMEKCIGNPSGNTDLMTAEILGNLRYPLAGASDHVPTPFMAFGGSGEDDILYDGVGNWLFSDWAGDMTW